MSISKIFFLSFIWLSSSVSAQYEIQELTAQKGVSIRSLSVPSEKVIWASGSKGMVAKSTNEGKTFEWMSVKGYENRDFRAMHAWNEKEAIIVAIAAPSVILKTKNGGMSWYKVYENSDTAMFLDAIHFRDRKNGTVIGDPVDGHLFILTTNNQGESWTKIPSSFFKTSLNKGEAFFASSNSNLIQTGKEQVFVTGGLSSRVWRDGEAFNLPIIQGTSSTGANSIAISPNGDNVIIVGGDFAKDKDTFANIVGFELFLEPKSDLKHLTQKKMVWKQRTIAAPNGYKSSIEFISNQFLITCGTSGVDISNDKGANWETISKASYHVVKKHATKKAAFLAGSGGRIGYIQFK